MKRTEHDREGRRERGELADRAAPSLPELVRAVPVDRLYGLPRSPIVEALLRRTRSGPQTPPGWHSAV